MRLPSSSILVALCLIILPAIHEVSAEGLNLKLTQQTETYSGSGRFHRVSRSVEWNPNATAVIVCDMWDSHHSVNAVRRVAEIAPRMNKFVEAMRDRGATIIHAPSDCMNAYADHPARLRATSLAIVPDTPEDISNWCDRIPSEESAAYPIDQSDGGEDDDLQEHQQWLKTLQANGRKPASPWLKQTDLISIDADRDFVSDKGKEVWSILATRKIDNVMLIGVHTNMCVLGRPFGLRQLSQHGKNAVLVRDLTDTMYNPKSWPYVNHFSGTDLIVQHIERYVCPTITSDQILGNQPFRFRGDDRKKIALLISENEYSTEQTLTQFAQTYLWRDFQVALVYGSEPVDNSDPKLGLIGLDTIDDADVLLISVRRKPLPPDQLRRIQSFVSSGKPVIGIRTANHAFLLRNKAPADGMASWDNLDAEVFGGSYKNHYANDKPTSVNIVEDGLLNVLLPDTQSRDVFGKFVSKGSLYQTAPLAPGTEVLLNGTVDGESPEPIAWTFVRADSGRTLYTSLGHPSDFESPVFKQFLINAIYWSADMPSQSIASLEDHTKRYLSGHGKQRK